MQSIKTIEEFNQLIKSDKLTVIDFYASWCNPCKIIAPKYQNLADDEKYNDVQFCKCDADEGEEVNDYCEVNTLPTFQFYKNNKLIIEFSGANYELLVKYLEEFR
jgi:thioredoxin 1